MGADVLVIAVAVALILVVMRLSWLRHMRGGDDETQADDYMRLVPQAGDEAGPAVRGPLGSAAARALPSAVAEPEDPGQADGELDEDRAAGDQLDEEWAERLHDINAELRDILPTRQEAEYERHLTWLDHHPACILQDLPEDVYDRCVNLGNDAYWRLRQGWLEAGQVRHAAERARFLAAVQADVELVDRWMGDGMPWTRYVPAAPAWIAA